MAFAIRFTLRFSRRVRGFPELRWAQGHPCPPVRDGVTGRMGVESARSRKGPLCPLSAFRSLLESNAGKWLRLALECA